MQVMGSEQANFNERVISEAVISAVTQIARRMSMKKGSLAEIIQH